MQPFDVAIAALLPLEGGYTADPQDSGGATIWGITEGTARAFGYTGDMRAMTKDQAKAVYRTRYWDSLSLDAIYARAPSIAMELFDSGVNLGPPAAAKFLQRSLNVLNDGATRYPDVPADGQVGRLTLEALGTYLASRGTEGVQVLLTALNSLQGAFYIGDAETRPKDERFVYGWLKNRVKV